MSFNSDIDILKALRSNKIVKVGQSEVRTANKQALDKARVIVNEPLKQTFTDAPKPSDFLLTKREDRIINNATFDERPKTIIEQNVPFSQPRSAKEIVEANLGKGFFDKKSTTVSQKGQTSVRQTQSDLSQNPVLAISNALNSLFGGLFK